MVPKLAKSRTVANGQNPKLNGGVKNSVFWPNTIFY